MAGNLGKGNIPQIQGTVGFIDFAPDADSITPGVLLDCDNVFPTAKGYRSYPSLLKASTNSLPSGACLGAFAGFQGTSPITVAGTATRLYQSQQATWVDTGLIPHAISAPNRWRFDIYGNDLIAVNGVDPPYLKPLLTGWQNLGGNPPVASIVQATEFALFLVESNSNILHASLADNIWTDNIATQTISAPIQGTQGVITAAHQLRRGITIYKRKAFHYGNYQGPPLYWEFPPISNEIGAPSQEAVANVGDMHLWPGIDDFYSFDGQSFQRIPNNLKEWFFSTLNQNRDYDICARWDQKRSCVFWHFPSQTAPAGLLDLWICLNLRTKKWSKGSELIEFPIFATVQLNPLTYGSFTTQYTSYGAIPTGLRYGDLRDRNTDTNAVFKSDHATYTYDGSPGLASVTTHDFGDRHNLFTLFQMTPQFGFQPVQGASLDVLAQRLPGTTPQNVLNTSLTPNGWFDCLNTARLQRLKVSMISEGEIIGVAADIEYGGEA
jgi:hypothetical protein